MPIVKTLKELVENKLGKIEGGGRWKCDKCGKMVNEISVVGNRWLCLECEKKES